MDAIRHCPAPGCGEPLRKKKDETNYVFLMRKTCGPACAGLVRQQAARRKQNELENTEPYSIPEELSAWHEAAIRNPPVGSAHWWR